MKKIALILFILISNLLTAQNFAPTGAIWHFENYCETPAYMHDCGFYTIEADRDTTINGNLCTILIKDTGNIVTDAQLIIWEDNGKVYFFENNQFKLLFDFNLNVGDTLVYQIPSNYEHYNIICGGGSNPSKYGRAIIDSTQILSINSQNLKTLYTSPLNPNDTNYLPWDLGQITERIGSMNGGFFNHSTNLCLGGFPGHFRCYADNLINYKPVSEDCDFVTGIDLNTNSNPTSIYPNPTSTQITIKGLAKKYDLTIYNTVGQVVFLEKNVATTYKTIDVAEYAKGLLFIKIESEGEVYFQKVVKE